jgi:hypothetical protein
VSCETKLKTRTSRGEALKIVRDNDHQLAIQSVVVVETNGINTMKNYNIPQNVFKNIKLIHKWYSSYMFTPSEFPKLT